MAMIQKYQKRISRPILDRINIHLEVAGVPMHSGQPDYLADISCS
jgi:hypothetical protein